MNEGASTSAAAAAEKAWRQMTPKELVYTIVKRESPSLTDNTLKTYASQLASFIKTVGAKSIGGAFQKTYEEIEKGLETVENAQTRASQLNAFISVIKHAKLPMGDAKYQRFVTLNDKLRETKMKPMEEGIAEAVPDNFTEKVNKYLDDPANKGTRESVFIATMALAPAVRPIQFQDVKIARNQEQYDTFKEAGESVIGIFGDVYRLWTKPDNRKVKAIDTPVEYKGRALETLKAYIKPNATLLFPSYKYPDVSVKSQMIEKAIKKSFQDADIGFIGAQKLRRIVETENQNDPSKSRKEKEQFSKEMNHSRDMGDKYKVVKDPNVERDDEAEENYIFWGKTMSKISSLMPKIADAKIIEEVNAKLVEAMDIMKGVVAKPKEEPKPMPKNAVTYRGKVRIMPEPKKEVIVQKKPETVIYYKGRPRVLPSK